MKVAIFAFTNDSPTLDTGVTTYNRELTRGLCERFPQHSFSVYLARRNSTKFDDLAFDNLKKIVLDPEPEATPASALVRVLSLARFWFREALHRMHLWKFTMRRPLYDQLDSLAQHDLVIYTVFGYLPDFPLFATRGARVPCVSAIHDVRLLYEAGVTIKERLTIARARYLLTRTIRESINTLVPSSFIRSLLVERCPKDRARIAVSFVVPELPDGAVSNAPAAERVRSILGGRRYIFYPSTIVETKNHLTLLRAMLLVRRELPDLMLVLAGSNTNSGLAASLFEYIAANALQDNVVHVGFVTEEEKLDLYGRADALIVPSIGESFSLPIWEAFACGCPVIASTDRDIPEQVADAALLCDPASPEDIARHIIAMHSDAELRNRMRERGRKRYGQVRNTSLFTGWQSRLNE